MELPVEFRILLPDKDLERHSLNIKSLSAGGLMFVSPVPLGVGTRLEMTLYNFTVQINFTAEVTWTEKVFEHKTSEFNCGLMFTQISDEHLVQIYHILNTHAGNHGQ